MGTFQVVFTPSDTGTFDAAITVTSDDGNNPTVDISLTGEVVLVGQNVKLISHLNDYPNIGYSDCWGYTAPNGDEYALLGTIEGVSIVNVTDPNNIVEVDYIPFVSAPPFGWYDMKTYQNYMYVSCEGTTNILMVDLSPLPGPVSIVGTFSGLTSEPHNIFIDTEAALLYAVEDFNFNPTVRIFSLADPENPLQVSTINTSNNGTDSHDLFAQDSVLYIAEGTNPSIGIYDMSDPANPALLKRLNIPAAGYVHQVWVSEDNNYMVTTEETPDKTVKVWDIRDLNNITLVSEYLGESQLAHNAYIKGDYIYISHYESGLKVLDFSNPAAVTEFGFYDTYLQSNIPGFNGAWGVYPFTSNEMIFVSDMQSGLYVLQLEGVVGIEDEKSELPERFSLGQNYPNPFNPTTTLRYALKENGDVTLKIYNELGQLVKTLVNEKQTAGYKEVQWNGTNEFDVKVASGVYIYRIEANDFRQLRKMIFLK
jgi:choice-of-anchor B domain-containing protein